MDVSPALRAALRKIAVRYCTVLSPSFLRRCNFWAQCPETPTTAELGWKGPALTMLLGWAALPEAVPGLWKSSTCCPKARFFISISWAIATCPKLDQPCVSVSVPSVNCLEMAPSGTARGTSVMLQFSAVLVWDQTGDGPQRHPVCAWGVALQLLSTVSLGVSVSWP